MKYIIFTFLLIQLPAQILAADYEKKEFVILDSLLQDASENEEALESFIEFIDSLSKNDDFNKLPILMSYKGVAEALKGKYEFWPFNKLSHLNEGLEMMNEAVNIDSTDIKIRYIRFTVIDSVPGILGYSSQADEEAKILYQQIIELNNSENKFFNTVAASLVKSERLSDNEVEKLTRSYNVIRQ